MTKRNALLTAFAHGAPGYVPVVVACDPYNQPHRDGMPPVLAERLGTVTWQDASAVKLARWFDLEVFSRVGIPLRSRYERCRFSQQSRDQTVIDRWETPRGPLTQRQRRIDATSPMYTEEHFIKAPDDLERLAAVFTDEQFELDPAAVAAVDARRRLVGDDGVTIISVPGTPLGMLVRVFCGVEMLAYLAADCPHRLAALLEMMADNYLRQLNLLDAVDTDGVWSVDDTSTTTISPRQFEQFAVPYIDRAAAAVQRQGKRYIHHSCGLIRHLLPIYRRTGMDAVHALTPPPIGDAPLRESKDNLGADITMMPTMTQLFDPEFRPARARTSVERMFTDVAPGDNVIFCMAPDPNRTVADMEVIVETVHRQRQTA